MLIAASGRETLHQVYEVLLANAGPAIVHEAAPEDVAILLYTGGTTGRAKGVPLSHLNIVSNALQLGFELWPCPDDVYLHVAPMFHSADPLAMPWVIAGAAHVFLPRLCD